MTQPENPETPVGGGGNGSSAGDGASSIAALRRISRRREEAQEQCELCGIGLPDDHEHLYDVEKRQLACACATCAVLSEVRGGRSSHRRVPRRYLALTDFRMTDGQWESLAIPVNMAFLTVGSDGGVHCHYPSPAGATESLLTLEGWEELTAQNPVLSTLEADVEALLVSRAGEQHEAHEEQPTEHEYFLVPIDACFELVGLIRVHWRGFSGGKQAWDRIGDFFAGLRARCLSEEEP
ncbi:MAG TPA: DUF5947 family protein [Candidatus Dormibacteraeota bacterium]